MPHSQGWPGSNDGAFLYTTPAARARVRYMAGGLSLCETRASSPYARIQAQGSWSREAGTRSCGRDGRRIARGAGADCCS
jgi:hypothetical protein